MIGYLILIMSTLLLGCQRPEEKGTSTDDLNSVKKSFLLSLLTGEVEESPFQMNYSLRTVFFSQEIVSLFGELHVYDHLPHGWWRYEGKTFCKIQDKLKEIKLWDLFSSANQREFLRKYCEDTLKARSISYFSGKNPLRSRLEYEDIRSFVIDDKFLIIFFQPYTVGGLEDFPCHVKIPFEFLANRWNSMNPLAVLLPKVISSKLYTASWDEEYYAQNEISDRN